MNFRRGTNLDNGMGSIGGGLIKGVSRSRMEKILTEETPRDSSRDQDHPGEKKRWQKEKNPEVRHYDRQEKREARVDNYNFSQSCDKLLA